MIYRVTFFIGQYLQSNFDVLIIIRVETRKYYLSAISPCWIVVTEVGLFCQLSHLMWKVASEVVCFVIVIQSELGGLTNKLLQMKHHWMFPFPLSIIIIIIIIIICIGTSKFLDPRSNDWLIFSIYINHWCRQPSSPCQ